MSSPLPTCPTIHPNLLVLRAFQLQSQKPPQPPPEQANSQFFSISPSLDVWVSARLVSVRHFVGEELIAGLALFFPASTSRVFPLLGLSFHGGLQELVIFLLVVLKQLL